LIAKFCINNYSFRLFYLFFNKNRYTFNKKNVIYSTWQLKIILIFDFFNIKMNFIKNNYCKQVIFLAVF